MTGRVRLAAVTAAVTVTLASCAGGDDQPEAWNGGVLTVGTGNTTGVFYQVGGGFADAVSTHLSGYEALVAPTGGSADNLLRLGEGDVDVALTFADVAADAVRGTGAFSADAPRIRALAAIYRNYTHLIVRADAGVASLADLKGKRISTGTPNSGTEFLALRMLRVAGIDPDRDIQRASLSLPATTRGLGDGSLDATFWSAGLPTVGITELLGSARGAVRFLPVDSLLSRLEEDYPGTYVGGHDPRRRLRPAGRGAHRGGEQPHRRRRADARGSRPRPDRPDLRAPRGAGRRPPRVGHRHTGDRRPDRGGAAPSGSRPLLP